MNNMKVKQLSIFLQNKKGSLYDVLETLSEHDINIKALSLADTSDFGILRVVVDNPQKGEKILEENYLVKTTDIVAIEMTDSPGGLSSVLKTIKENNLDLEYLYAFTHDKKDKAILLLHTDNPLYPLEKSYCHNQTKLPLLLFYLKVRIFHSYPLQ